MAGVAAPATLSLRPAVPALQSGALPAEDQDVAQDLVARACPRCAASARADAPWCTQCWLDLRPAAPVAVAAPAPVPAPAPAETPATADTAAGPYAPPAGWPCATCGATNPLAAAACTACGADFLAQLRADEPPLLVLPGVGDLTRLGRGARTGGALALLVVVLALLVLLARATA